MNPRFKEYLLKVTNATSCKEIEVIQSLWSGYGSISRYQLDNALVKTVVVKCIALDQGGNHPRGWDGDNSHQRKVRSYKVETHWYEKWSHQCTSACRIPTYIGSFDLGQKQWIILEDLDPFFPLRKYTLVISEVHVCLEWLANFHARFMNKIPSGLWEIGTYWHLDTRPDEYRKMKDSELKRKAETIHQILNQSTYTTIVHGDAKLANFCFSENGESVGVVDFQYVGGGCGMKDVAYFLGSCLSSDECSIHQNELLDYYFAALKKAVKKRHEKEKALNIDFTALEEGWRELYPIAVTDFTRFLLGWMPMHQKVNDYHLHIMNDVLSKLDNRF